MALLNGGHCTEWGRNVHFKSTPYFIRSTFIVGNFHYPPFTRVDDGQIGGIEINLVKAVAQHMAMNVVFKRPSDGLKWGSVFDNGTVNGLIKDVMDGVVHLGHGQFFTHYYRVQILDMTEFYDFDDFCVLTKKPQPNSRSKLDSLFGPFHWKVWLCFCVTWILAVTFFALLIGFMTQKMNPVILGPLILFAVAAPLNQPGHIIRIRANAFRIGILFFTLAVTLFSIQYSSSLVSFLTVNVYPKAINAIEELNDVDIKVGAWKSGQKSRFLESENENHHKLAADEKYFAISDWGEAEDMAEKGRLAMMDSRVSLEVRLRQRFTDKFGRSEMRIMDDCWRNYFIALILKKNSPYTEKVNHVIRLLRESGIIHFWKRNELNRVSRLAEDKAYIISPVKSLTITDMQAPFIIYCIAMLICFSVFLLEIMCVKIAS